MVPVEIIGLVKDSRYANLRGETPAVIYQPFLQTNTGRGQMSLHVRVAGGSGAVLPRIREEVQKIDKDLPLFEVHTLAEEMDGVLVQERLIATLSSFFGGLALLLACVGLYGLLGFAVVQRTGEMGLRMALGASRVGVIWMVMKEALIWSPARGVSARAGFPPDGRPGVQLAVQVLVRHTTEQLAAGCRFHRSAAPATTWGWPLSLSLICLIRVATMELRPATAFPTSSFSSRSLSFWASVGGASGPLTDASNEPTSSRSLGG